jgi:hypothetical protein
MGKQFLFPHPSLFFCFWSSSRAAATSAQQPARVSSLLLQPLLGGAQPSSPSQAAPELDSESDRAAHPRKPRPWPWAHKPRSVSTSYKVAATSYLILLSLPASFNATAFKPLQPSRSISLVAASPSMWGCSGGSSGGAEAARAACGRSRAPCRP